MSKNTGTYCSACGRSMISPDGEAPEDFCGLCAKDLLTEIHLKDTERSALVALGGYGYVPLVEFLAAGRQIVRPVRGSVWRTQDAAQKELGEMRYRNAGQVRRVVRINRTGAIL